MKKVIVYPGRFQPMLAHHAEVFQRLQAEYPDATVYIGTSNKVVMPNSPFDFSEKQQIAQAHGIPADRVLQVRSPYNKDDYPFDQQSTQLIIAVGEKDTQRFPFNNPDPDTGLDMSVRGEPKPKYLQPVSVLEHNPAQSMDQHAYVLVTPNVQVGDKISSASAFREAIRNAPDQETAKQVYTEQFGEYNDQLFTLIYNRLTQGNDNMNEQLNIMRRLAGMPIAEGAPVGFYDMTDQERQLAAWGRVLMDKASRIQDDEFSNTMATVGDLLTRWGTPGGPNSQEDVEQKAGITTDMLEKFLAFAEKHQDEQPEVPDPEGDEEELEEYGDGSDPDQDGKSYNHPRTNLHDDEDEDDDLEEDSYHSELTKRDQDFEQGMAQDKADFKRREMEYELRGEEEAYQRAQRAKQGPFYLKREDKIIKDRAGQPFEFRTREAAEKAARTMMQKHWNKGKKFYLTKTLDEQDQAFMDANDLQEDGDNLSNYEVVGNEKIVAAAEKFAEEFGELIDNPGRAEEYEYEADRVVAELLGMSDTSHEDFVNARSDLDQYVNQAVDGDSDDEFVMPDGDYEDESDSDEDYAMPNESVENTVNQASDQALAEIRKLAGLS